MLVSQLPAWDPSTGRLNAVIDTPKGSRNKYKFDDQTAQWRLTKVLPEGMVFPYDFGFIPSTRNEDGDPVDVLLLSDEPSFAGCVVPAVLIGVVEAEQTEKGRTIRNDRLIAVVETPYNPARFRSLNEVDDQRLWEIEQFFVSYNRTEGRNFKPIGRQAAARAIELIERNSTGQREPRRNGRSKHRVKKSR